VKKEMQNEILTIFTSMSRCFTIICKIKDEIDPQGGGYGSRANFQSRCWMRSESLTITSKIRRVVTYGWFGLMPRYANSNCLPLGCWLPPFGSTVTKTASMSSSDLGSSAFKTQRFLLTLSS